MAEEEVPVVPEEAEEEGGEPRSEPVTEEEEAPPTTDEPPSEAEGGEDTDVEPVAEVPEEISEPPPDVPEEPKEELSDKKGDGVKQLFDSKGSLLDTESFVRDQLEGYKQKRAAFAVEIKDLQAKVTQYKEKENPTDDDIANLKKYHTAFLAKLGEFEDMTRNVERLMGMSDVPTSQLDMRMSGPPVMKSPKSEKPEKAANLLDTFCEDKLPKLIVCGTDMGDNVPRIIVCEPLKKTDMEPFSKTSPRRESREGSGVMMSKLNECYEMQQRLAAENAQICELKCQLQTELLDKRETLDCLRQKVMTLESEKYRLCSENKELQKKLLYSSQTPGGPPMCKRELYMKFRGSAPDCPDTEGRYPPGACQGESPTGQKCPPGCCQDMANLEEELDKMDNDVQSIFNELENLQKDKTELGYSTAASFGSSPRRPVCKLMLPQKGVQTDEEKEKDLYFESDKDPKYNDLREQYQRLHGDFKTKVAEVATLRVELDKTKKELDDITVLHHELEAMHQKELEQNLALMGDKFQAQSMKDQLLDLEQQANVAKQMYKSSQDEVEEMRALVEDQASMLDDYRNKYMKTLQIAEELKKENEFKERECADQIAIEIQRAKLEMQEQLEELSPIKDLLKISQQKLKETEQMHTIALETIAEMSKKLEDSQNEVDLMKSKLGTQDGKEDITANLQYSLEEAEKRMTALESENARLKEVIVQLESLQTAHNQRLEEKSHELLQMIAQLETLREESARQVARVKERSEMVRKCMQAQIAEMEREVAQCRATTAFANRERDEIKSRLQLEVCLLSDNFRESQNRIVQLQQHVNYLSASHPTALIDLV